MYNCSRQRECLGRKGITSYVLKSTSFDRTASSFFRNWKTSITSDYMYYSLTVSPLSIQKGYLIPDQLSALQTVRTPILRQRLCLTEKVDYHHHISLTMLVSFSLHWYCRRSISSQRIFKSRLSDGEMCNLSWSFIVFNDVD